jgi:putative peptide zinc metalloprotease protein
MTSPAAPLAGAPGRALLNPRLRQGIRLLGEMQDTGFTEEQFLLRAPDGQFCRLSGLLYHVAEAADGTRDHQAMAEYVSVAVGKQVSADNIEWLIKERLAWVVTSDASEADAADHAPAPDPARDPLLALRFRKPVVGERVMGLLATPLQFLFTAPGVMAMVVVGLLVNWLLWTGSTFIDAVNATISHPFGALSSVLLFLLGTVFHEIGHATALKKGGGRPGVMGVGLYLAWPAFYTDVTDSYRLPRWSRVRVDLGGIYFNLIFGMAMFGLAHLTGFQPLIFVAVLMEIGAIQQLLPLVRLDGYWILSDILGVPDLFSHLKTHVEAIRATRKGHFYTRVLRKGPARAFTIYALTIMPLMMFFIGMLLWRAPHLLASALGAEKQWVDKLVGAANAGNEVGLVTASLQGLLLLLGPLAITLSLSLFLNRTVKSLRKWAAKGFKSALMATGVAAALATALFFAWIPASLRADLPGHVVNVTKSLSDKVDGLKDRDDPTMHRDPSTDPAPAAPAAGAPN